MTASRGRSSDALQALVAELVDIDHDIARARANEEAARSEFLLARQQLDNRVATRQELEERYEVTKRALVIIQERDGISEDTVRALVRRAGS